MTETDGARAVIDWLIGHGPRAGSAAALLDGYCRQLRAAGVPVDRSTLGAPLLHPIAQSSYVFWSIETGSNQRWFKWTPESLETMRASPIYPIYTEGAASYLDLTDERDRARYPIGTDLWEEGFTAYDAVPLAFSDGTSKALTLATREPGGFTQAQRAIADETLPALALAFEGYIARNAAQTLMETYVGKRAGLEVLDGRIARGDGSVIEAVIWFSDLRGFTSLSQTLGSEATLAMLNDYFGLLTDAIEANDGEVLKFIGDALLAIFAHDGDIAGAVAKAEAAAFAALDRHAAEFADRFDFGVALHPGRVFYGNIGGGERLDFTVIGEAVNVAARIEGLTGKLGEKLLVSSDLVAHSSREWVSAGQHELKGVAEPMEIFNRKTK